MCLRLVGSALCCCCKLGLKCLCFFVFSTIGVLIIVALVVYFCFFYNKTEDTTTKGYSDSTMETTTMEDSITTATDSKSLVRAYLHRLIDRI
ncbi:protein midgut expression 1 [Drosophila takahashii]|uniref:protein midgut expression 1 n=1 Tax=Drosophila takahashii TaxID=29030 RepID=UPI001CF89869|nr:protein midgut expression 1 [Drosophila takahashii]